MIKILHIGIKYWSYIGETEEGVNRGGGSIRYCDSLLRYLSENYQSIIITRRLGKQLKYEERENILAYRYRVVSNRVLRHLHLGLVGFAKGYFLVLRERHIVIHGHLASGGVAAVLLAKITGKKSIVTPYMVHDAKKGFIVGSILRFMEMIYLRYADQVVYESQENLKRVHERVGKRLPNAIAITTGVRLGKNKINYRMSGDDLRILYIGRLVPVKAVDRLIAAYLLLLEVQRKNIFIDIIGEGDERQKIKMMIEAGQASANVTLHGFIDDLEPFYDRADLFLLPSYREGLSIALLEAMARGIACVASRFASPFEPEIVFRMEDNSSSEIARAILHFFECPAELKQYGQNARKKIEKEYSQNQFIAGYETIYKKMTA